MPGAPSRWRRGGPLAALVAAPLAIFAIMLFAAWSFGGDGIPHGTRVLGVDIGGLAPEVAAGKLEAALRQRARQPIPVRVDDLAFTVSPAEAGLEMDYEATALAASTRPGPVGLLRWLAGGREVEPVVRVDATHLDATVTRVAQRSDRKLVEGAVVFREARAVPVHPAPGRALDQPGAALALREGYLAEDREAEPLVLPAAVERPRVSGEEVDRVLREFAEPAVAAPVTLSAGGARVDVPPSAIAGALRLDPSEDGRLVPRFAAEGLGRSLTPLRREVSERPVNATIRVVNERPEVVPGRPGRALDAPQLERAVIDVLPQADRRVVPVPVAPRQPKVTTEQIAALGIRDKLSTHTQRFPYAPYRERNIGTAARYLDGTLLRPGEVFSMNGTVKKRSPDNGYVVGQVVNRGRLRNELGGGVSTVTTAVWDAAFHAGLERVEQRAHSIHLSRYKPGLEATVVYGALDLKVRNSSPHGVFITSKATPTSVTVTMWGTKEYDVESVFGPRYNLRPFDTVYDPEPDCVKQPGSMGFDIDVTRIYRRNGVEVRRETFPTHYEPGSRVLCRPEPYTPVNRPPTVTEPVPVPPIPSPSPEPSAPPTPDVTPTPTPTLPSTTPAE